MVTNTIALTLVYIVANFLEYFSRLILKRIPNYDHDFLATGCQAAIVGLSFYLGALQTRLRSNLCIFPRLWVLSFLLQH